jgi:hypothetical protein
VEVVEEYSHHAELKNVTLVVKDDGREEHKEFDFIKDHQSKEELNG